MLTRCIYITKAERSISKPGHLQPCCNSKARSPSIRSISVRIANPLSREQGRRGCFLKKTISSSFLYTIIVLYRLLREVIYSPSVSWWSYLLTCSLSLWTCWAVVLSELNSCEVIDNFICVCSSSFCTMSPAWWENTSFKWQGSAVFW